MSTLDFIELELEVINHKLGTLKYITSNIDTSTYKLWKVKFHYDTWKPLISTANKLVAQVCVLTNDPNEQERIVDYHQDIWTKYHKLEEVFNEIFSHYNDSETKLVSKVIDPSHSDGNLTNSDIKVESSVPPKEELTLADIDLPIVAVKIEPLVNSNPTCDSLCNYLLEPLVELTHDNRSSLSANEIITVEKIVVPDNFRVSSEGLTPKQNYDFNINTYSDSKYAIILQHNYSTDDTRNDSHEPSTNDKVLNINKLNKHKCAIRNRLSYSNINHTFFIKQLYFKYNYIKISKVFKHMCRSETNGFRYGIAHMHPRNQSNKRKYANNSKLIYAYPLLVPIYKTFSHMSKTTYRNSLKANSFNSKPCHTHGVKSPQIAITTLAIAPMCTSIQIKILWGKTPEHRTKIWNTLIKQF